MAEPVQLLPAQEADEVLVLYPVEAGIEITGEKAPDKSQAADEPGPFQHAEKTTGHGKEGVAANGVGSLPPNNPPADGAEGGALEAVVDNNDRGVTQRYPTLAPGIGFIQDIPAIQRLQAADGGKTFPAVKFCLTGDMKRGIAFGHLLAVYFQKGDTAGHADLGIVEMPEDRGKTFRAKFKVAIQFGDDIIVGGTSGGQAGIKSTDDTGAQLPLAATFPANRFNPGMSGGRLAVIISKVLSRLPSSTIIHDTGLWVC